MTASADTLKCPRCSVSVERAKVLIPNRCPARDCPLTEQVSREKKEAA